MGMKFSAFKLDPNLIKELNRLGYVEMTEIQQKAIPYLLRNESGVFKAPTGSGKTLCYLAPILSEIDINKGIQALIILPTNLLIEQVKSNFEQFASYKKVKVAVLDTEISKASLKESQVVLTTPNKLYSELYKLDNSNLKRIVLDEGDMLLFDQKEETDLAEAIQSAKLSGAKKFLFTASIPEHLDAFTKKFIKANKVINVENKGEITSSNVTHYMLDIKHVDPLKALVEFIKAKNPYKLLVFVSNADNPEKIASYLNKQGIQASYVSKELSNSEVRKRTRDFKEDRYSILIATDRLARGFDDDSISDVLSYSLPLNLDYYFHRAGRCGRYDKKGNSYVFYSEDNNSEAKKLYSRFDKFKFAALKSGEISYLKERSAKPKINNKYLEKEIKHNIYKLRSSKVKPNYKKKVRQMIERTKKKHKEDVIKKNLAERNKKEGTSFSYFEKKH